MEFDGEVEELELSVRAMNALRKTGCKTLRQLLTLGKRDLGFIPGVGRTTIAELEREMLGLVPTYRGPWLSPDDPAFELLLTAIRASLEARVARQNLHVAVYDRGFVEKFWPT